MKKSEFENKSLVLIILIGYIFNLVCGFIGYLCVVNNSSEQMLFYQIGNAFAISASVMAARYTGLRAQQVAASAYILLSITHGISLAALTKMGINVEREVTMAIPMIPALVFMIWCDLFPKWLRAVGIIPSLCFALEYFNIQSGQLHLDWALYTGYATLQIVEVIWGIYIFMDWRKL